MRRWKRAAGGPTKPGDGHAVRMGLVEVEIPRAEIGSPNQRLPIWDRQLPSLADDQALALQTLEHSVDMNRGQADRIGELLLGERKIVAARRAQTERLHPGSDFA